MQEPLVSAIPPESIQAVLRGARAKGYDTTLLTFWPNHSEDECQARATRLLAHAIAGREPEAAIRAVCDAIFLDAVQYQVRAAIAAGVLSATTVVTQLWRIATAAHNRAVASDQISEFEQGPWVSTFLESVADHFDPYTYDKHGNVIDDPAADSR